MGLEMFTILGEPRNRPSGSGASVERILVARSAASKEKFLDRLVDRVGCANYALLKIFRGTSMPGGTHAPLQEGGDNISILRLMKAYRSPLYGVMDVTVASVGNDLVIRIQEYRVGPPLHLQAVPPGSERGWLWILWDIVLFPISRVGIVLQVCLSIAVAYVFVRKHYPEVPASDYVRLAIPTLLLGALIATGLFFSTMALIAIPNLLIARLHKYLGTIDKRKHRALCDASFNELKARGVWPFSDAASWDSPFYSLDVPAWCDFYASVGNEIHQTLDDIGVNPKCVVQSHEGPI